MLYFCIAAKGTKPDVTKGLDDVKVTEGKQLKLEVLFKSKADCKVNWLKNDDVIPDDDRIVIKEIKDGSILSIKSAKIEDSGTYMCEVSNEFGTEKDICAVDVEEIREIPEFVSKLQVVQVSEGKTAEFQVKVKGTPKPNVEWFKDDKKIESQERYEIVEDNSGSKLIIKSCKFIDKGRVKCIATNIAGEKSCWADLLIQQKIGPPRIEVIGDLEREIDGDKDILLEAEVTGKPKAKAEWSKKGKPIVWSTRKCEVKTMGDRYSLRIVRANEKDAGDYKLIATSSAGKETVTFVVKTKG